MYIDKFGQNTRTWTLSTYSQSMCAASNTLFWYLAGLPGFEPRTAVLETDMIPFHHSPILVELEGTAPSSELTNVSRQKLNVSPT